MPKLSTRNNNKLFILKRGFSLFEILLAICILSLIGITVLKSLTALKKQNHSVQKFLLTHANLFETQLFFNKHFSIAKPSSLIITQNSIQWESYNQLFLPARQNNDFMDFSLQTTNFTLTYMQNALFLNHALLLHDVNHFSAWLEQTPDSSFLHYKICTQSCIQDFILLDETITEITLQSKQKNNYQIT